MKSIDVVTPSVELLWMTPNPLQTIEAASRTCYNSEARITKKSAEEFIYRLISNQHEAMMEHASASFRIVCDRGISHELVRHRLFSFAQESTRYCNYGKKRLQFIQPSGLTDKQAEIWFDNILASGQDYLDMLEAGAAPQIARSVLPTCLKTEIVVTGNFRQWRHFLKLRTAKAAHPDMRFIACCILKVLREKCPPLVADIKEF